MTHHFHQKSTRDRSTQPNPLAATPRALLRALVHAPLRAGDRVPGSPWIIVRPLGEGGVGQVFEVEHALLGRRAALKVLLPSNAGKQGYAARLADEGRLLAMVRHDNIVDVLDLGTLEGEGLPYLVLELLDGRDLAAELARVGVLSVPTALAVAAQILDGLAALHRRGFVHRDIKPENLFLCSDGRAKILDLGAAEPTSGHPNDPSRGAPFASPRTMAPEQAAGRPVDERADLYALGLVLYELVAGRGPFEDVKGFEALRFAHLERKPEPPSRVAPQPIPAALDALILRAIEKDPDARFPSAEAMVAEIAAIETRPSKTPDANETFPSPTFLTTPVDTKPPALLSPSAWNGARHFAISALAVACLAAGVVAGRLL